MSAKKTLVFLFPVILLAVIALILFGRLGPGYSDRAESESIQEASEEFLVNDDFSTADQGYPDIAVDATGNFRIVWQDNREGNYSVYEQYFVWDGERLGPNALVNDDANSAEQYDPHIGMAVNGYTKMVWQDYRAAGYPTNPDIYAQDIDENGSAVGPNAKVNADFGQAQQRKPNLDMSPSGLSVVVWEDYRNNNWDIFAQWYDASGAKLGGNVKVNDDVNNAVQHRPFSAADGLGNTLICWYDDRSGSDDVFGQVYDINRTKVGANFLITDPSAASVQKFPAACGLPGGGFVVVWVDYRNGPYPNDPDIYAQKLTAGGQKIGANFRVNDDGSGANQTEPQIGSAPTNGFVICWRDEKAGTADIYARRYDPSGTAAGAAFMVNNADNGVLQSSPAVAMSDAKMYVTWTDNRNSGLFDIYGRIITYDNPRISLIPSFVLFSAEDGQANPPAQQVTVANSGAGVLEWAATETASWLTVSPVSGTAPTTVTLQVNITGMSMGNYSATVTFKDQNDPQVIGLLTVNLSITYGKPIISVSPATLTFQAGIIGPHPAAQQITITNTGGKTLNWHSSVTSAWISLSPASGAAPSTVAVSIDPDTLSLGTHQATISILDPTAYNPRVDIPVTCEVVDNSPVIGISDTALHFQVFERRGNPLPHEVLVSNTGEGALNFAIDSTLPGWLSVYPLGGLAPQYVSIAAVAENLDPGSYSDTLWFADSLAANSPVALPVTLRVDSVPPEIHLSVSELNFSATRTQENPSPNTVEISNSGGSELKWTITHHSQWLNTAPDSGTGQQEVTCGVEIAGQSSGTYSDTLIISDPNASNSPQTVTVHLLIEEPDTLTIPEVMADAGQSVVVPLDLLNADSITDMSIPLRYDKTNVHLDSAGFGYSRVAAWMFKSVFIDSAAGTVKFFATAHSFPTSAAPVPPGSGPLAHLYVTVAPHAPPGAFLALDTATLDLSPLLLTETGGVSFAPCIVAGGIWVNEQTGVLESPQEQSTAPVQFVNYPNPFNSETVFFLRGNFTAQTRLVVYDLLGRVVRDLTGALAPGEELFRTVWDGTDDRGARVGSGVYFAVLHTGAEHITRKMLVLR